MNKLPLFALSWLFAGGVLAAAHSGVEAQKPANPKAQAAAEEKHNAKPHGTDPSAKQPQAQMPANAKSQAAAEQKHNAKPHGLEVVKTIPLEDGSNVIVFKDGKMGMEDKLGRSKRMKPGQVMKAKDGTRLVMVGDEVMRVESMLSDKKGAAN